MIKRSIPWTIQPPIGVGPNKKWIDRGLVALFDCRQARELISGDFATNRTSLIAPSTRGIAADFSGSANQQYAHRPAYAVLGPITIAALCDIDALTNYSPIITKMGTTTTNVPYELRVGAAATDSFINFARANTSVRDRRGASNRLTVPFKGLIAVTAPSGLIESAATLYVNNVPTVLSSNASGTGLGTDNGSTVWIGRRYDGATQLDGRIYYVPLFNAELSGAYLKELYDNPWDIYEPQQRNIYVSVAGGQVDYSLTCSAGAYAYTGQSASLSVAHSLSCAAGSYSYSGVATTLTVAHNLVCATGAYTYSGVSAALPVSRSLSCASGSYTYSGVASTLSVARGLSCDAGSYTYAGVATTLAYIPGDGTVDYVLTCAAGAYAYTGQSVTLAVRHGLTCDAGAYSYSGVSASLQVAHGLTCDTGVYGYTGQSATLSVKRNLACATGSYDYIGNTATLDYLSGAASINYVLTCAAGAYTYGGQSATLTVVSSWAGEPFNFASPITRNLGFTSSITKNLNFESPI